MKHEDIQHLAMLSRITLTPNEVEHFATDMDSVLSYIETISEITGHDVPRKDAGAHFNQSREDGEPHAGGIYTDELLTTSEGRTGAYIQVQSVLPPKNKNHL